MYHRIDELAYDPFELAVSPANFEQQLAMLRRKWNPVTLPQLAHCVKNRYVMDRSVVLTFDDGYVDNFDRAIPLLERYHVPATFYITTGSVEQREPFWWDELQAIFLESQHLPAEFTVRVGDESVTLSLGNESSLTPELDRQHRNWTYATGNPPTKRSQVQMELWRRIKPLLPDQQRAAMSQLRALAGRPAVPNSPWLGMTPDQIRLIREHPLFTLGAHTHTHASLADHEPAAQEAEIRRSRQFLEQLTGQPVAHFSYPFGSHNSDTVKILAQENLETSVTTNGGTVLGVSQPLQLNRYQVNNWHGPQFHRALATWYNS